MAGDILLFSVLLFEAHVLVGWTQWPTSGPFLAAAVCAALVYFFKPHFVTILTFALPAWVGLQVGVPRRSGAPQPIAAPLRAPPRPSAPRTRS